MASEDITPIATQGPPLNLSHSQPFSFSDHGFCDNFLPKLASFHKNPCFTDMIVKAKHLAMPCHKVVLCAASPFFESILASEDDDDLDIVDLHRPAQTS